MKLSGLELRRPRIFAHCWLACELWQQLGLDEFWQAHLPEAREAVSWEKVLRLLVVNRLLDPGSEFRVHRQWFVDSALDELLQSGLHSSREGSAVSVSGSNPGIQTRAIRVAETEVGGLIRSRFRSAALRSDQHLFRRRDGTEPKGQARLQPRRTRGLSAVSDRVGDHAGWISAGL